MHTQSVKGWIALFLGILSAILIADVVSSGLVSLAGVKGWHAFLANFVVYAVTLFAVITFLKKYGQIDIFNFGRD